MLGGVLQQKDKASRAPVKRFKPTSTSAHATAQKPPRPATEVHDKSDSPSFYLSDDDTRTARGIEMAGY